MVFKSEESFKETSSGTAVSLVKNSNEYYRQERAVLGEISFL